MFPAEMVLFFTVLGWSITITVNLAFAVGVWADASSLLRQRTGPMFVGPLWWMLGTLVGGVFVAGVYWAMHHSNLRPTQRYEEEKSGRPSQPVSRSEQAAAR
jgi:hypothetical protein